MNIFKKTINDLTRKAFGLESLSYNLSAEGISFENEDDFLAQVTHKDSLYITAGLRIIKDVFSAVNFELYEIVNTKGEIKAVEIHPILDILYKPNPLQTKLEFSRLIAESFILSKDVFIRIIKKGNKPEMLIILNPSLVDVKFNEITGSLVYVYTRNGKITEIPHEEIIHIKDSDLNNQTRGRSDLAPILQRAMAEASATTYQRGIFARNGNPDAIMNFPDITDSTDLLKIKTGLKNSFNGKNDEMRIAVVGGKADLKTMNNTSVLDYATSQKLIRDDIMIALGVPKALITSDDVNRANADAALEQFMRFTIVPMYKLVLEALNERFVIPYYGEKYLLTTENLVNENKETLLKELTMAVSGSRQILTVNEARQRLGYEPAEGKDTLSENQSFVLPTEIKQNLFKTRSTLYAELKVKEIIDSVKKKDKIKSLAKQFNEDATFKVKFSKAVNASRARAEKRIKADTKVFMQEQYSRIIKNLEKAGDSFTTAGDLFDFSKEKEETKKYITPAYISIAEDAGNTALIPVKMLIGKSNNFIVSSGLIKEIESRAKLFSEQITETTYTALSQIVAENVSGGVAEIKKALKENFYDTYIGRIDAIARTESCYMTSLGTQIAYNESEVVSGKQWLSTLDAVVRPEHQIDGEIVDKDSLFSNGESFPGEKSINCRCVLAPVVDINNL